MVKGVKILLLEDSATDAELIVLELDKAGIESDLRRVDTKADFENALASFYPDVILSDYHLPSFDGVSALAIAVIDAPDVPFIFVSGAIGEELAIDTLRCGATDYILKDRLARLGPAVERALQEAKDREEQKRTETALLESFERIRDALGETVRALASVAERRDPYTAGHQRRVARLACAIAEEMGMDEDRVEGIRVAGVLHDIGKVAVPAEILTKPSRLEEVELNMVRVHPGVSFEIIDGIDFPWPVATMVYQHHERMDGSGYPEGLKGTAILPEARILAVADVVEAMASHRPYRPALGIEKALEEISLGRGTRFDPAAVDACVTLFRDRGFELD